MPNIQGRVNKIYDNRLRDGKPNKFPNFKIMIGEDEITLWSAQTPVCREGDNVSINYGVSKKNGSYFVLTHEDKRPMIQVMPEKLDDPLPNGEMEATSFEPVEYEKEDVIDKKGMTIFVQGMIQAFIRSGQVKIEDNLESLTANLIDLYKKITK